MSPRRPSRVAGLVVALTSALSLALGPVPAGTALPAASPPAPLVSGLDTLDWSECPAVDRRDASAGLPRPDVLCASVPVPVDHAAPAGRTTDVHVRRITATEAREGVVFGNPGGPGGDARTLWYSALDADPDDAIDQIRRDHDLVIVQPRGLAQSGDLVCAPDRPALGLAQSVIDRKALACRDTDPELVRSLTTENVVRDHDLVRERMGLERVSFLGYSYGTALGMMYQALFPERLERLVLDSAVGPTELWWRDMLVSQASHRHEAVYYALEWMAEHHDAFGLGRTSGEVYRAVAAYDATLGVAPPRFLPPGTGSAGLADTGSARLDGLVSGSASGSAGRGGEEDGEEVMGYLTVLDYMSRAPMTWPMIAWAVSGRVTGTRPDTPSPQELLGHMEDVATDTISTSDSQVYFRILTCNEDTSASDPLAPALLGSADLAGSTQEEKVTWESRADRCPFPPSTIPPRTTAAPLVAPPLVIQSDHDPNTPGPHGPRAAAATGGVLVRVKGTVHGHFDTGNRAVDDVVLHYLRTGDVAPGQYLDTPRPMPGTPPWGADG